MIFGIVILAWSQAGYMSHITISSGAPKGSCGPNELVLDATDSQTFVCPASGTWPANPTMWNYKVPTGLVTLITNGSCPTGWTEVSALNGVMLRGTLAANGDVGGIGGNTTITPAGTISIPTFTGTSNQTTSAVSAGTPSGTNSTASFTPAGTNATASVATVSGSTKGTNSGGFNTIGGSSPGSSFTIPAEVFTGTVGTIPAETFTGSALATHTHTLTPSGTISTPTFTGTAVDPSPRYMKVIFCSAN